MKLLGFGAGVGPGDGDGPGAGDGSVPLHHHLIIGLATCRGLTFSSEQTSLGTLTHSLTSSRLGRLIDSLVQIFSGLMSQVSFGTDVTN